MNPITQLDEIRIASPCHVPWGRMKGDDRVRFCDACGKHVYNLAAIPSAESLELIRKSEGAPCVRLSRRRDGTLITGDCPVGRKAAAARRLRRLVQAAALVTGAWALGEYLNAASSRLGLSGAWSSVTRRVDDLFRLADGGEIRGEATVAGTLAPFPAPTGNPAAPPLAPGPARCAPNGP